MLDAETPPAVEQPRAPLRNAEMKAYTEDHSAAKLRAELTELAATLAASNSPEEAERGRCLSRALTGESLGDAVGNAMGACCDALATAYPESPDVTEFAELF